MAERRGCASHHIPVSVSVFLSCLLKRLNILLGNIDKASARTTGVNLAASSNAVRRICSFVTSLASLKRYLRVTIPILSVKSAFEIPCVTEETSGLIKGSSPIVFTVDCGSTSFISMFSSPSAINAVVKTLMVSLARCLKDGRNPHITTSSLHDRFRIAFDGFVHAFLNCIVKHVIE